MAHLSLVLEGREDVGPPEQLEIGVRVVAPDLLEQILEANHEKRCLTHRFSRPGFQPCKQAGRPEARLDAGFSRSIYWPGFGRSATGPPIRSGTRCMIGMLDRSERSSGGYRMRTLSRAALLAAALAVAGLGTSGCNKINS